jgi:long-subunit acyl-CoA synthetase (AMP-forming)
VALQRALLANPLSPALDDLAGRGLSRAGLLRAATRTAARLRALDARRVALLAENGIAWVVMDLAARLAGASLVPLPPFFSDEQLAHALEASDPDLMVTSDAVRLRAIESGSAIPGSSPDGLTWLTRAAGERARATDEIVSFSSGSTGRPKGARLSARTLLSVTRSLGRATGSRGDDVHLCSLPLPVLLEAVGGVYRTLLFGGTVLVPELTRLGTSRSDGVDGAVFAETLREHRATSALLVPGSLQALLDHWPRDGAASHALRFLGVGGAATPHSLLTRAEELDLPVHEGYGLTECASVVCLNTSDARRLGSVGRALPHARVVLGDDGELLLGGPRMRGYLGHRAAPADDLLPSGDLGRIDEDGFVFVDGRKGNRFITRFGRNVSPEWIESRVLALPSVRQVVVLGEGLDAPRAVLVTQDGERRPDDQDLARVNAALPSYARLAGWIHARQPFTPDNGQWTATGRPLRLAIRDAYAHALPAASARPVVTSSSSDRLAS